MRIIVARTRIAGTLPFFEYRVLVPFAEISAERQDLIHYRSHFGRGGEPIARVPEVIAPIGFLRLSPGLQRFEAGRRIAAVAKRVEAVIAAAVFPEMTAETIPLLHLTASDPPSAEVVVETMYLAGEYDHLALHERLTGTELGLMVPDEITAAA